jgi:HAE1 family hydrophobic/amphiphilic exporter-1
MWFTRVSLRNPVFATMVMLAFVVLGLFSYQRLAVDQFPDIDFPVVVVTVEYPGASPEIVETEVTRKIEEGVNTIAGISSLTSRSYQGRSVVIVEFQLHIDGRRPPTMREKVASVRPTCATRSRNRACCASTRPTPPSGRWPCCPMARQPPSPVELTTWADQVLKSAWRTCAAWAPSTWWAPPSARSTST